jgi:hypothetical protein
MAPTSSVQIDVYDGTRQLLAPAVDILYRVIDGNQKEVFSGFEATASLLVNELPFYDNWGDDYTVIASADGYRQAGFTPVRLALGQPASVALMLLPNTPRFDFSSAKWAAVKALLPFLAAGVSDAVGRDRYNKLMRTKPRSLAGLLNITTAMSQIFLPIGTPLEYIKQIKWDESLAQDRFFAYCDATLVDQVRTAAAHGEFAPETGPGFFHPGATASWKQLQFGEANVQLTFHEGDQVLIDGVPCVGLEPDIDYYKDVGAHALLEVIPSMVTGGLSNPETVYVLRWIAGRHAGVPEFSPPFTIRRAT